MLPALVATPWLPRAAFVVVMAASLAAGFGWMWRAFRRRLVWLGLGRGWNVLWALSLLTAMVGTLAVVGRMSSG